ncbi:RNA polymerase subunit sigma-70 [Kouleothrix aurantiaca]|uniref:RNA polymerase subunit sigma-70 n=1 Tax=Kouleothrix aurantiaca TaxID=186479 RepID=A0A0N8PS96_9CHLR|nr:RNA polymerase subunit sigma-70 [Kouleothrix aurantiaca]
MEEPTVEAIADVEELANDILEEALPQEPSLDSVQHYLQEIGRVSLLSAAEEVDLAERMERGKAAVQRMASAEELSQQLRVALRSDIASGQDARRHLIQANLRLVVSIAKKYVGRGLALLDLIQEGNIGLMRATIKFDHKKGFRFSTYATWWVKQAITRSLADNSRLIRMPVHVGETMGKIRAAQEQLSRNHMPIDDFAAIAAMTGISERKVEQTIHRFRQTGSLESLEAPITGSYRGMPTDGESTLGDFLADPNQNTEREGAKSLLREDIFKALGTLSEREREILILRYGLEDGEHRTLEVVGQHFGITRERIRQIEAEALRKLRHPVRGRALRRYMEGD